jgi:hypothetical protein
LRFGYSILSTSRHYDRSGSKKAKLGGELLFSFGNFMSKIGEKPITLSPAVNLKIEDNSVILKALKVRCFCCSKRIDSSWKKTTIFKRKNNEKSQINPWFIPAINQ